MKTIKILTIIAAFFFIFVANSQAQTRSTLTQNYVFIEVPSGLHQGEIYEGTVTFTQIVETTYRKSSTTIAYMNKAELISSIPNGAGLTKSATLVEKPKPSYRNSTFESQNQYILIFDDGTSCDVSYALEIRELIIKAVVTPTEKKAK